MKTPTTAQQKYLQAAEVFHCAYQEHYVLWMTGKSLRHSKTERALPSLVKKGYLVALPYGKKKLYATPDRIRVRILSEGAELIHPYHGLAVTDILLRYTIKHRCMVMSEKSARVFQWGIVPEVVFLPRGANVLLEFCTRSNVEAGKVKQKANKYNEVFHKIQADLQGAAEVLFVLDIRASEVEKYVQEGPFRFIDYASFKDEYPLP